MKNIIETDTSFIGTYKDLEELFRQEMIYQLQNGDLDFEELKYNFQNIFEVFLRIEKNENENKLYDNDYLVEIKECPMGGYSYDIYKKIK